MGESVEPTVVIHGDRWRFADIAEAVADCRTSAWARQIWKHRPALVHRSGGRVSLYVGQKFNPDKIDLVPDGWNHDHCEICWWDLGEDEDPQHGIGYTDGHRWICTECYHLFIAVDSLSA